jgi:hypothetical protein
LAARSAKKVGEAGRSSSATEPLGGILDAGDLSFDLLRRGTEKVDEDVADQRFLAVPEGVERRLRATHLGRQVGEREVGEPAGEEEVDQAVEQLPVTPRRAQLHTQRVYFAAARGPAERRKR